MARKLIRKQQWKRIQDVMPGKATDSGGTAKDNRLFLEAVLWITRTRSPWRDLPPELGNWHATSTRFSRWRRKGVWQRVVEAISGDVESESLLNTILWPIRTKRADPWPRVVGTTRVRRNHKDSNYVGYAR
jgi:putative transposase